MSKLRLELDEIRVESFSVEDGSGGAKGTVRGHGGTIPPSFGCFTGANGATCPPIQTCPECAIPPSELEPCDTGPHP